MGEELSSDNDVDHCIFIRKLLDCVSKLHLLLFCRWEF